MDRARVVRESIMNERSTCLIWRRRRRSSSSAAAEGGKIIVLSSLYLHLILVVFLLGWNCLIIIPSLARSLFFPELDFHGRRI